jgi:phosphatidylglycerol:prolipoprotein diacylglycerol transferase
MRPVLLQWRGRRIRSYPALCYVGLVLGIAAQNAAANAAGLATVRVHVATLVLIPVAIVGVRLLFVATHWPVYREEPQRIWRRSTGGMAMYGALPSMLLVAIPLLAWLEVPYWPFWDASVFCLLVLMIFARLGCFLHGCCGGRASEGWLAWPAPDAAGVWERRVPTQLLEIGWTLVLLWGAILASPHVTISGTLFVAALIGYGIGRLVLQPARATRERLGRVDVSLASWGITVVLALTFLMLRA